MSELQTDAKYQIGTVARVTGLSTHTLRVWERRYGVVTPARTPGGSRVYSDADVSKLRLLKRLTDEGHSIGRIAHLSVNDLRAMTSDERGRGGDESSPSAPGAEPAHNVAEVTRHRFHEALDALDITAAERLLLYAAGFLEPRAFVLEVAAPILEQMGRRWQRGELRIAHEHAASALLRNVLGALMRTQPPQMGAATAVATTLSGELHELGALMAALMAAVHGWRVVYLGPNLPASEILHVLELSDAAVLLISMVDDRNPDAERELGQLMRGLPAGMDLIVGGRSAHRYADLLGERATVTGDLVALESLLTRARH